MSRRVRDALFDLRLYFGFFFFLGFFAVFAFVVENEKWRHASFGQKPQNNFILFPHTAAAAATII